VPASPHSQLPTGTEGHKRELDWSESSSSNSDAPTDLSEGSSEKAQLLELSSYAVFRSAKHAGSLDEFGLRIREALAGYKTAATLYGTTSDPESRARELRSKAMLAYLTYWLETNPSKRKRTIEQTWTIAKKALEKFEELGNGIEYGETYSQLSTSAFLSASFDWSSQSRQRTLQNAAEYGEKAIAFFSAQRDPEPLVKAYVKTASYFGWLIGLRPCAEARLRSWSLR